MNHALYERIAGLIGTRPYNLDLYVTAFTHRSVDEVRSQERLEHLGDSVLGLCVTEWLYERYPASDEGTLTQYKAKIVSGDSLAEIR